MVLLVTVVGPTTFVGSFDRLTPLKPMEPLTNEPHCLPELTGGYNAPYVEKLVSCPHAKSFLRVLSSFRIFPSVAGFEFANK